MNRCGWSLCGTRQAEEIETLECVLSATGWLALLGLLGCTALLDWFAVATTLQLTQTIRPNARPGARPPPGEIPLAGGRSGAGLPIPARLTPH